MYKGLRKERYKFQKTEGGTATKYRAIAVCSFTFDFGKQAIATHLDADMK